MKLKILVIAFFSSAIPAFAQHEVEFMAARPSWADSEFVGHAFMVISTRVANGSKEDAFGFYPRKSDSSSATIGGPSGIVESEFTKNPARFSRITNSMRRPITDEERRTLIDTVNEFNRRDYRLTNQSCIDFVNTAAQKLGWNTPPRESTDLPTTFLSKLEAANAPIPSPTPTAPPPDVVEVTPSSFTYLDSEGRSKRVTVQKGTFSGQRALRYLT